jgi:hypothetical protein
MRATIAGLERYIARLAQGKRILFCWCDPATCPSNLPNVFAFEDDYAMGVLCSRAHGEGRAGSPRRSGSTPETFPWPPAPTLAQRQAAAGTCVAMMERRAAICAAQGIGLTALYNQVDEGAWADLAGLHRRLDEAVAAAYGWPPAIAQDPDQTNARLLELNRAVAEGRTTYEPFAYLATPPARSDAETRAGPR